MHKHQLFCYTYAGGTAAFFDELDQDLEDLDVVKFEYAGHGTRHREPFYSSFDELAEDAFSFLEQSASGGDYSLLGYSMGCISLAELLKKIIANGWPLPKAVFLAAHDPQTRKVLFGLSQEELENWVRQRTISFGAVPERLINNRAFWRTYLPIYTADYGIIGKHRFEELGLKTDIPATVFYSETDTPLSEMKLWENYFTGPIDYYRFEGPHFFLKQYHREIAGIISRILA